MFKNRIPLDSDIEEKLLTNVFPPIIWEAEKYLAEMKIINFKE
jgi:hypothetical protein